MKLKVCGMRQQENIEDLSRLAPHYMGFIFWASSSRYVEGPGEFQKILVVLCDSSLY